MATRAFAIVSEAHLIFLLGASTALGYQIVPLKADTAWGGSRSPQGLWRHAETPEYIYLPQREVGWH